MTRFKRLLSMLLAAIMCGGVLPTAGIAAEIEINEELSEVADVVVAPAESLSAEAGEGERLLGDVNGDGDVNIGDALSLFRYSMLAEVYPVDYPGTLDLNDDGEVDIGDALSLFRYSMLPEVYPIEWGNESIHDKRNEELEKIAELNGGELPEIYLDEAKDVPNFISGKYSNIVVADVQSAIESLEDIQHLMLIDSAEDTFNGTDILEYNGLTFYRLQQEYKGLPVYGKQVIVSVTGTGEINGLSADYEPLVEFDITPDISKEDAKKIAEGELECECNAEAQLIIFSQDGYDAVAWMFNLDECDFIVDAKNGEIHVFDKVLTGSANINTEDQVVGNIGTSVFPVVVEGDMYYMADSERNIWLHDLNGEYDPPAFNDLIDYRINSVDNNWKGSHDAAAALLYTKIKNIYDYYQSNVGIVSTDGEGIQILAFVNVENRGNTGYANRYETKTEEGTVYWAGVIGIEEEYENYRGIDLAAHEYSHLVEGMVCDLTYSDESGAIKEAYADFMGELVEESVEGQTDWIWINHRNLRNPASFWRVGFGSYPTVYKGDGYSYTFDKVHHNSTVISHALYKLYTETELTSQQMAELLYHTLFYLPKNADFSTYYISLYQSSFDLGYGSDIRDKIYEVFVKEAKIPRGAEIESTDMWDGEETVVGGSLWDQEDLVAISSPVQTSVKLRAGIDTTTGSYVNIDNTASSNNRYEFRGLEPGYYTVEVMNPYYETAYQTIVVSKAYSREDAIAMQRQTISLTPKDTYSINIFVADATTPSVQLSDISVSIPTLGLHGVTKEGKLSFAKVPEGMFKIILSGEGYPEYTDNIKIDREGNYYLSIYGESAVASGKCGDNLTWVLNENGMLTISGTGDMWDWWDGNSYSYITPWASLKVSIINVVIGNGVTSIARYSFAHYESLVSVTIPDSVTTIGEGAFIGCSGLTSVTIPDSVTTIGDYAFFGCSGLTSVTIGNSVTNIGNYAFYDCSYLTSAVIPDSVTTIGEKAFSHCSGLTSIAIPDSVTTIGDGAFEYCDSLTSVTIPDSVTTIGSCAFRYCSSSLTLYGYAGSTTEAYAKANGHNFVAIVEAQIVASGECGDNLTWTLYDDGELVIEGTGAMTNWGSSSNVPWYSYRYSITTVTIGNSVTSIGAWAFYACDSLTSVTIPDSVTSIGYAAFDYCTSLTNVTIPDSVTSIGAWAFTTCTSLTSVVIPDSVTSIGDWAFSYCNRLTRVVVLSKTAQFGSYVFRNTSSTLILHGYAGFTTEAYAKANGHNFAPLSE